MKPSLSRKVSQLKQFKSPVREIMDFANPQFFRQAGLSPDEVISFSGGWVNHETPNELRQAYTDKYFDFVVESLLWRRL